MAVERKTGQFVIVYSASAGDSFVREYTPSGQLSGQEHAIADASVPSVSIDGDGTYFVGLEKLIAGDKDAMGIMGDAVSNLGLPPGRCASLVRR